MRTYSLLFVLLLLFGFVRGQPEIPKPKTVEDLRRQAEKRGPPPFIAKYDRNKKLVIFKNPELPGYKGASKSMILRNLI